MSGQIPRRGALVAIMAALLCGGCHLLFPFDADPVARPNPNDDAQSERDAMRTDLGTGADHKTVDAQGLDAAPDAPLDADLAVPPDGGAVACIQSLDNCPTPLACHCCGSIGPKPICICTTTCGSDSDCTRPSQPHCNKISSTAKTGLCTPAAFNCCWLCL